MTSTASRHILLWLVFLIPPVAWFAVLLLDYGLQDLACSWQESGKIAHYPGWMGPLLVALDAVLVLVIVAAGLVGLWLWRRDRRREQGNGEAGQFMGLLGAWLAALFLVGVVLLVVNPIVFQGCS